LIASERHDPNRDAGGHKHSQAHVKGDHTSLEYPRSAR
jgi:hypothetical protein